MLNLGIIPRFVDMVMRCTTPVSFPVMFKRGKLEDFQAFSRYSAGDPVSSYLFLLATEGLLSLLTSPLSDEIIQGIQVALEAPHVNHLLFC